MMRWGWRMAAGLLLMTIAIIAASCLASQPSPAFTPTPLPPITLTLWLAATATPLFSVVTATPPPFLTATPVFYNVRPGDTLSEIAQDFDIEPEALQAANYTLRDELLYTGQKLRIPVGLPTLTPQPLYVMPPRCQMTANEGLLCMGAVRNDQDNAVGRVSVRVELRGADGALLASELTGVEQRVIPAKDTAPYRVMFKPELAAYAQMIVALQSADPATPPPTLRVDDESVTVTDNLYTVAAQIENPGSAKVENVRVVLTLYHAEAQIVGYRVIDVGVLDAGQSLPIEIAVLPLSSEGDLSLSHTLYVEAWMTP